MRARGVRPWRLRGGFGRDEQSARAVVYAGGVAGGDGAFGLDHTF